MDPKNPKLVPQFRVEGLNVNGVECSFTGSNLDSLEETVTRAVGGDVQFGESTDEHNGIGIFRRGDKSTPIGWISAYYVPESMSVTNNPRLQRVA